MSKFSGAASVEPRKLAALIGSARVNEVLGLAPYLGQDRLHELLAAAGVEPVGTDARGNMRWDLDAVTAQREALRAKLCRASGGAADGVAEAVRNVLEATAGEVIRRALDRNLSVALDDTDARLDRLQEGVQGLFRQQGESGQRVRDVLQVCSTIVADQRAGSAALKKDVAAALGRLEANVAQVLKSLGDELQALRMSVNDLRKGMPK